MTRFVFGPQEEVLHLPFPKGEFATRNAAIISYRFSEDKDVLLTMGEYFFDQDDLLELEEFIKALREELNRRAKST